MKFQQRAKRPSVALLLVAAFLLASDNIKRTDGVLTFGTGWMKVPGGLKLISIGDGRITAINRANEIYFRSGVKRATPFGLSWQHIPGHLKQISLGDGKIMGIDKLNNIYYRSGISKTSEFGTGWFKLAGSLKQISVGDGKIMGVNDRDNIFYRSGIDRTHPYGVSWKKVVGKLSQISVGDGNITGSSREGNLFSRSNVDELHPYGTGWVKVPGTLKSINQRMRHMVVLENAKRRTAAAMKQQAAGKTPVVQHNPAAAVKKSPIPDNKNSVADRAGGVHYHDRIHLSHQNEVQARAAIAAMNAARRRGAIATAAKTRAAYMNQRRFQIATAAKNLRAKNSQRNNIPVKPNSANIAVRKPVVNRKRNYIYLHPGNKRIESQKRFTLPTTTYSSQHMGNHFTYLHHNADTVYHYPFPRYVSRRTMVSPHPSNIYFHPGNKGYTNPQPYNNFGTSPFVAKRAPRNHYLHPGDKVPALRRNMIPVGISNKRVGNNLFANNYRNIVYRNQGYKYPWTNKRSQIPNKVVFGSNKRPLAMKRSMKKRSIKHSKKHSINRRSMRYGHSIRHSMNFKDGAIPRGLILTFV